MKHLRVAALAGISLVTLGGVAAFAQQYQQSPVLDGQDLPPVAERVGSDPRVVTPVSEVGKYGGTFRGGMVGGNDRNMLFTYFGYEPLLTWDADWSGEVFPNIASAYTASEDSKS